MYFNRTNYPVEKNYPITVKDGPDGSVMTEDVKIPNRGIREINIRYLQLTEEDTVTLTFTTRGSLTVIEEGADE